MNKIIKLVANNGLSEQFRTLCIIGGAVAIIICAFVYGKKLGLKRTQIITSVAIAYPFLFGLIELSFAVSKYFARNRIFGLTTATYSGIKIFIFLPLISFIVSKIVKIPFIKIMDFFALVRLVDYPISSMGCLFTGCCRGYPCSFGVYSPETDGYYFPVQIINILIMCAIIIFLWRRTKKRSFVPDGKQLPLMLILFGSTFFITEFLKDSEKLFLGISALGINCILICVVGVIMLIAVKKIKIAHEMNLTA